MHRYCLVRKWRSRTCCSHLKISPTKKEMSIWSLFTTYFSLPSSVEVQTIGICEVSESHKTTIEMCLFTNCGRLLKQSCVTFYHYRLYCSHGFALITRCKTDKVIVFIGIKLNQTSDVLSKRKFYVPPRVTGSMWSRRSADHIRGMLSTPNWQITITGVRLVCQSPNFGSSIIYPKDYLRCCAFILIECILYRYPKN